VKAVVLVRGCVPQMILAAVCVLGLAPVFAQAPAAKPSGQDRPTTAAATAKADAAITTSTVSTASALASEAAALEYLRLLEAKNKDVTSMVGAFDQTKISEMFLEKQQYKGRFYYRKPNNFRIDYTDKEGKKNESTVLVLANEMWEYVPSIQQATCMSLSGKTGRQREINQVLLGFGVQVEKAQEFFRVDLGPASPTGKAFTLIFVAKNPDETMQFLRAEITFDRESLRPRTIVLEEASGDRTEIQLGDVKFNEPLKDSLFEPSWPEGTEKIKQ